MRKFLCIIVFFVNISKYKSKFFNWPEAKRKKLQVNLKRTGYYNGRTDGYWDKKLIRATILAVAENFPEVFRSEKKSFIQPRPTSEYNPCISIFCSKAGMELTFLLSDELRAKYEYEFAVAFAEREQKEKLRQKEEAAKERERKKREAQEQKLFCENAQNSDFWNFIQKKC